MRAYFRHLVLIGAKDENPAAAIQLPRRGRLLPRVLSPAETETSAVKELVRQKVAAAPKVRVSPVGTADLIAVRAESTSANLAASVANAYADSYIEFRRKQNLDELLASRCNSVPASTR